MDLVAADPSYTTLIDSGVSYMMRIPANDPVARANRTRNFNIALTETRVQYTQPASLFVRDTPRFQENIHHVHPEFLEYPYIKPSAANSTARLSLLNAVHRWSGAFDTHETLMMAYFAAKGQLKTWVGIDEIASGPSFPYTLFCTLAPKYYAYALAYWFSAYVPKAVPYRPARKVYRVSPNFATKYWAPKLSPTLHPIAWQLPAHMYANLWGEHEEPTRVPLFLPRRFAQEFTLSTSDIVQCVSDLYSALAHCFGFGDGFKNLIDRIKTFSTTVVGIRNVFELFGMIQRLLKSVLNALSIWVCGYPLFDSHTYKVYQKIDDFYAELIPFQSIISNPNRTKDEADSTLVFLQRCQRLALEVATIDQDAAPVIRFRAAYAALQKTRADILATSSVAVARVTPVSLMLVGPAGKGKTQLVDHLLHLIHAIKPVPAPQLHRKAAGSDYDDGYTNQSFIQVEEFAACSKAEDNTKDALAWLVLINSAPLFYNMSRVDYKGLVYDQSHYVFGTTNRGHDDFNNLIRDKEALDRRMHFKKYVVCDPAVPHDVHRLPALPNGSINWNAIRVSDDNHWENGISVSELAVQMVRRRNQHERDHTANTRPAEDHFADLGYNIEELRRQAQDNLHIPNDVFRVFTKLRPIANPVLVNFDRFVQMAKDDAVETFHSDYLPMTKDDMNLEEKEFYELVHHMGGSQIKFVDLLDPEPTHPADPEKPPPWYARLYVAIRDGVKSAITGVAKCAILYRIASKTVDAALNIVSFYLALAGLVVAFKALMWLLAPAPPTSKEAQATSYSAGNVHQARLARLAKLQGRPVVVSKEAQSNTQTDDMMRYCTSYVYITDGIRVWRGVAIGGNQILLNYHYYPALKTCDYLDIITVHGKHGFRRPEATIVLSRDTDTMLLMIPNKAFPAMPDITKHFILENDIENIGGLTGKLRSRDNKECYVVLKNDHPTIKVLNFHDPFDNIYLPIGLSLPIPGNRGDCGELAFCYNVALGPRNIMGIHCAGDEQTSDVTLVSQELLTELRSSIPIPKNHREAQSFAQSKEAQCGLDPVFLKSTTVDHHYELPEVAVVLGEAKLSSSLPNKTALRKTPMYGKFRVPHRLPAHLRPQPGKPSPYNVFMKKVQMRYIDDEIYPLLGEAYKYLYRDLRAPPGMTRRKLTLFEAINGVPGVLEPLDMKTSPGYPFTKLPGYTSGKESLFVRDSDGKYMPGPYLQQMIDDLIDYIEYRRDTHNVIYTDTLKDELLLPEKVDRARVFNASPVHKVIVDRMYFGVWVAATDYTRRIGDGKGNACGIDTWSNEGTRLMKVWYNDELAHWFFDYSKYDTTQVWSRSSELHCASICSWYNPDPHHVDNRARTRLAEIDYHSVHIVGHVIYTVPGVWSPSGKFTTTPWNGGVNAASSCAVYCYVAKKAGKPYYPKQWFKEFYYLVYGDDCSFSGPKFDFWTYEALIEAYKLVGLEATYAAKTATTLAHSTVADANFLKRHVETGSGIPMLALDLDLIYDIPNYADKKRMNTTTYFSMFEAMLRESVPYGQTVHSQMYTDIQRVCAECNFPPFASPTYEDLLSSIRPCAS
jgi:hypothetical protein